MEYQFANRTKGMIGSPLRENAKKNMDQKEIISFAYGFPPTEAFPMETLKEISQKIYAEIDPQVLLQYGATEGYAPLRKLIKNRLAAINNLDNDEEIMVVSGSTQAMDVAVKVLCDEGDIVLCEEMTFSGAVSAIKGYGAVPMAVPMNIEEESMDLVELEKMLQADIHNKIKMLYIIPTFQNPLGTSIPLEKRQEIYKIAQKYDVIIFEDDPYGDLLYEGDPIPKIKEMDVDGRVIYAGSFSKILAPATRLGFIMAADALLEKLIFAKQVSDSHSNFYWQVMLAEFMENYQFEKHVDFLKDLYKEKLITMMHSLDLLPKDKISYIPPTGGYFICCKLSETVDMEKFYQYLDEYNVAVIPGNLMSVEGYGYEHYIRLNFTKPTLVEILTGIKLLGEALTKASSKAVSRAS